MFFFSVFHSAIQESIKKEINDDPFLIVYKSGNDQPGYIADQYCCGDELFKGLVNR